MYKGFNDTIKKEIIVLSNLQGGNENSGLADLLYGKNDYFISNPNQISIKFSNNKQKIKEISDEQKKIMTNKLKDESLETFYKKNIQKDKELESILSSLKLRIKFTEEPKFLKEGKFYIFSGTVFTIYDEKSYSKLYEIKFETSIRIKSVILLENNDLIFVSPFIINNSWRCNYELLIYRLKDKIFTLVQKIKEDKTGFLLQYESSGCILETKDYSINYLKEISGNRFICISNHGIKIYSMNEKNEYSLVLLNDYQEGLRMIHEINKNKFIFCNHESYGYSLGGPGFDSISIDMIEIKEKTKDDIVYKKEKFKNLFHKEERYKDEDIKVINSLKLKCEIKNLIDYKTGHWNHPYHNLSNYVIVKNKYFIIMIDNNVLLFDLINGNQLKRYEIVIEYKDNLYIYDYIDIEKWNNTEDNEFILSIYRNIFLFDIEEDENNKLNLKIVGQSSLGNNIYKKFKKLFLNKNKFYSLDGESNCISIY